MSNTWNTLSDDVKRKVNELYLVNSGYDLNEPEEDFRSSSDESSEYYLGNVEYRRFHESKRDGMLNELLKSVKKADKKTKTKTEGKTEGKTKGKKGGAKPRRRTQKGKKL